MNHSLIDYFAQKGKLAAKDVSPFQTFAGKGMKFWLQSFDWEDCACVSNLSMRAFLGLMKMESLICTPYSKDLPLFSIDNIHAFGKQTLIIELYDTQVHPVDLSTLDTLKESFKDLKDKDMKPAWYDKLRLSPSTFKVGRDSRMSELIMSMTNAYLDLFSSAQEVDRAVKTAKNSAYVEELINRGGPAINTVRDMLGASSAETLFRRFLFGTEQ